jgi:5-methylcytosine-specific restriction endonuclease McrA
MPSHSRGLGRKHDLETPAPGWGGRKAQEYVRLTLQTYGDVCWLCRLPGANTADHVIPRSKGGAVYDLQNLAPAHKRCNESRGNRPPEAYTRIEDGTAYFTIH